MAQPPLPHARPYDPGPPAPRLTDAGECSDCKVAFTWAGGKHYKICSKCLSVLWHTDWAVTEREEKATAAAAAKARTALAIRTRQENQAKRRHVYLFAEDLVAPSPVLGEPDVD